MAGMTTIETEFLIATSAMIASAVAQGWDVKANDRHVKFASPTGKVTFMARSAGMFADRTIANMRARLVRDGLAL